MQIKMIKPEEIRVGNYYNSVKFAMPVKCEMVDLCEIYQRAEGATPDETHIAEIFESIPLNEDWLIKSNLEKRQVLTIVGISTYYEYSIRNDFDIYCYIDKSGNCSLYGECIIGEDFFIIKCDTVHEFQNIFKVLAGKELTINETIKA